jgi:hypothetical protein
MPTAKKRVLQRTAQPLDLTAQVHEYLNNRSMRERSEWEEGRIKKALMEFIEQVGELQEGGHRTVLLDSPASFHSYKNGKPAIKSINGIERKRRLSQSLNPDRTMALLEERKLVDQCTVTETITSINEDAILAANYEGTITDEELAKLYDESETFAFYLVEGEG